LKTLPEIQGKVLHTLHFYALIQGKVLPPLQKSKPDSEHDFLRSDFYALISGKVLHTLQKSKRNLRHTFATPAKLQTDFRAYFCYPCNVLSQISGS
jgi:hypothetical protein